jgi:IS5 family transposase
LIRPTKPAQKLLADKAYDSAALRQWLRKRGTKAIIPNKSNRKQPFSSTGDLTNSGIASRMLLAASRTFAASQRAMTGLPETSWHLYALSPLLFGGSYES